MKQDVYNGQMIEDLASLTTRVMLALSTDDELFEMVLRIIVKLGPASTLDLQELALLNQEMQARAKQTLDQMPRGNA